MKKLEKKLSSELISRKSALNFLNFTGILPNPDRVLKRTGKTIEAYRDLKNDAHVWSCIQSRKSGLLNLEHTFSGEGKILEEIKSIFEDIDIHQLFRDILEAPLFGYQPIELIWKIGKSPRKIAYPEQITAKPQEWFFFDTDGNLRFRRSGRPEGEIVPEEKIICVKYESDYLNPYGSALLSKCYWPVTFKSGGLRFWINYMEKYGMPLLIGSVPRGSTNEEAQTLAGQLAEMNEDTVIVVPKDVQIEMEDASGSGSSELYRELIRHCNGEISKAILSQTLTTELDMGSYAASMTHYRVRKEVIRSDQRLVEQTINKIIGLIGKFNFPGVQLPEFSFVENISEDESAVERDTKLSSSGAVSFKKKYWMRKYGFRDDEID